MRLPLLAFIPLCSMTLMAPLAAAENPPLLIKHGYIMTMEPGQADLPDADMLIRDNHIVAIGHDLPADNARVLDAHGSMVLPGFVDTHSHLWITTMRGQFRNGGGKFFPVSSRLGKVMSADDSYTAIYTGALELIDSGITSSADFYDNIQGPAWADAGIRALQDSGIRAVMFYGGPDKTTQRPIDMADLSRLAGQTQHRGEQARVRLGLAWRLPKDLNDEHNWAMRDHEYQQAKQLGLPVQVHVSGQPKPMFDALIDRGYLAPSLTVVHATDASADQLAALQQAGGSLALTPRSEQRVGYGLTRIDHFSAIKRQGLGIDGNSLSGSGDMFETLRLAALTFSGGTGDEAAPDARALLELATLRAADAIGLGKLTGSLKVGKRADVQIINPATLNMSGFGGGDPAAWLVYSARPENVDTVLVEGRILKQHGQLVGVDLPSVLARAQHSARAIVARAKAE